MSVRALVRLSAAVLVSIGIGVGLVVLNQAPLYQLSGHSFRVRFPISLSSPGATVGGGSIGVHGLITPPDFEVSLAEVGNRNPPPFPPSRSGAYLIVDPAKHLTGTSLVDVPNDRLGGRWTLSMVNGFVRHVDLRKDGEFWVGNEIVFNEHVAFLVTASAPAVQQVGAFLNSFVPIS